MFGSIKNIVLGIVILVCIVLVLIVVFKDRTPDQEYTGRPLLEETESDSLPIDEEQYKELVDRINEEKRAATIEMDIPNPQEDRRPKMAPMELARLNAEEVQKRRKVALANRDEKDSDYEDVEPDSDREARLAEIREARRLKSEEKGN